MKIDVNYVMEVSGKTETEIIKKARENKKTLADFLASSLIQQLGSVGSDDTKITVRGVKVKQNGKTTKWPSKKDEEDERELEIQMRNLGYDC